MTLRSYIVLFLLGLAVALAVAWFQSAPGYMDADYYFAGGLRLAQGYGFSEPFLWNYLDDPAGLPHPSHAYWMPLASILAAAGMVVGEVNFASGRIAFMILAGLVPVVTAALAYRLRSSKRISLLAGLLATLSGFYLPFMSTTETFGIYMVLGGLFLLAISRSAFILGLIAGLMHLARADGLLWLAVALGGVICSRGSDQLAVNSNQLSVISKKYAVVRDSWSVVRNVLLVLIGYLVIMGPWMGRNLAVFGTPLAPGGMRALWLTNYDELFSYPASGLTFEHWWGSGLGSILEARLWAAGLNLQTALGVQASVFLAPLIVAGAWRLRRDRRVQVGLAAWALTFLAMTLVFPFPGARGGFFHSSAAVQPLLWALAPVGLEVALDWGARKRGWKRRQAGIVFSVGMIGLAALVSLLIAYPKIVGADPKNPVWNHDQQRYAALEEALKDLGAGEKAIVMVNNPPGYYVANGRPAIFTPDGDMSTTLAAAERHGAEYLLLEANHPRGLEELYREPGDHPDLDYLRSVEGTRIFRILED